MGDFTINDVFSLLFLGGVFFLMMRYGCGSHMRHSHKKNTPTSHSNESSESNESAPYSYTDPVCGMKVEVEEGYGKMHDKQLYRFCSRKCLDKFDEAPEKYINQSQQEASN